MVGLAGQKHLVTYCISLQVKREGVLEEFDSMWGAKSILCI
jgi:hypothetical protein